MYIYTRKERAIAFKAEASDKFLAAMLVSTNMASPYIYINLREMFQQMTQERYIVQIWDLEMFIK